MTLDRNTGDIDFIEKVEDSLMAMFLNNYEACIDATNHLKVSDFVKNENKILFGIIHDLIENQKKVDEITILDYLKNNENRQFKNYELYITKRSSEYKGTAPFNEYIEIIKDGSTKRSLDRICGEIMNSKWDFTSFNNKLNEKIAEFNDVAWDRKTIEMENISETLKEYLSNKVKKTNTLDVVPTGINAIDKILSGGGFEKGTLNVLAAAPGVGKTAFALNVIKHECDLLMEAPKDSNKKQPQILFFCLEMTPNELIDRLIAIISEKPSKFFNNSNSNEIDNNRRSYVLHSLENYPLKVNINFKANIDDISSQISLASKSFDLKLVVIDHLHIMEKDGKKDENIELANITRRLKSVAKDKNIPILLLSQVTKDS
jgi:replicative DNA helicase